MDETYFIRVKKDYALAVIEDLEKMDAVEIIAEDDIDTPGWHKEEVLKEVQFVEEHPESVMTWDKVKQNIKRRE